MVFQSEFPIRAKFRYKHEGLHTLAPAGERDPTCSLPHPQTDQTGSVPNPAREDRRAPSRAAEANRQRAAHLGIAPGDPAVGDFRPLGHRQRAWPLADC